MARPGRDCDRVVSNYRCDQKTEIEHDMTFPETMRGEKEMSTMESLDSLSLTIVAEDSVMYESPFWGQHGISLYATAKKDGFSRNILVDVAQDSTALLHNMTLMGIEPSSIDGIVLTHCHYDHTQGLVEILKTIGKKDVPVIAHPDLFRPNFIVKPYLRHVGVMSGDSRVSIENNGGYLFLTTDPLQIMPGLTTTGLIPRQTDFEEVGIPLKTIDSDNRLVQDPMNDDISLIAVLPDKELVILSGCSHAGIVNITKQSISISGIHQVRAVIGGLHLVEAPMDRIIKTVDAMHTLVEGSIYAGHCTGFNAQVELRKKFGDRFAPLQTGMKFDF
jgi:7,8-dihydropterin-6-yl-methyl-4-(beta-D-ribofuranosyl)aminobenzene 5'-phosphate synthase